MKIVAKVAVMVFRMIIVLSLMDGNVEGLTLSCLSGFLSEGLTNGQTDGQTLVIVGRVTIANEMKMNNLLENTT